MASLKNSLIAHYKMNDNAANPVVVDETGNHNGEYRLNGVAQNTDTGNETGKINGALDFIGGVDGEMVVIPDHVDFSPGDSTPGSGKPFSISVWVYMHDASEFIIASKNKEWYFKVNVAYLPIVRLIDDSESSRIARFSNTSIESYENQWTHLVFTFDGGDSGFGIGIYLNDTRIDDTDNSDGTFHAVENFGNAVWIGRYDISYANGLIDNLMFFNKELTLNDVKVLYNSGRGTENIPIGIQLSRTGHRFSSFPEN